MVVENYYYEGPRHDSVEIDFKTYFYPCKVVCFLKASGQPCSLKEKNDTVALEIKDIDDMWVLVQYYTDVPFENGEMNILGKPRMKLSDPYQHFNYGVFSVHSIRGHAYLPPDFDNRSSENIYFWDKWIE